MNLLDALNAVQNRLRQPEHWTKGTRARDALGNSVDLDDPLAVSFDIQAAILLIEKPELASSLRDLLRHASGELFLSHYNDDPNTTHTDIMKMFDDARTLLEDLTHASKRRTHTNA